MIRINDDCLDALKEIVNVGIGQAAGSLNSLLDSHIDLQVPDIAVFYPDDSSFLSEYNSEEMACVRLGFSGNLTGNGVLLFPPASAAKLVVALTGEEPGSPGMDAVMSGTLNEVGNIVLNGIIGSISNILDQPLDFLIPEYVEGEFAELIRVKKKNNAGKKCAVLLVKTYFHVKELQIEGSILLLFEVESFDHLLASLEKMLVA